MVRVREWEKIRVRKWLHFVGCASDSKLGCGSDPSTRTGYGCWKFLTTHGIGYKKRQRIRSTCRNRCDPWSDPVAYHPKMMEKWWKKSSLAINSCQDVRFYLVHRWSMAVLAFFFFNGVTTKQGNKGVGFFRGILGWTWTPHGKVHDAVWWAYLVWKYNQGCWVCFFQWFEFQKQKKIRRTVLARQFP